MLRMEYKRYARKDDAALNDGGTKLLVFAEC